MARQMEVIKTTKKASQDYDRAQQTKQRHFNSAVWKQGRKTSQFSQAEHCAADTVISRGFHLFCEIPRITGSPLSTLDFYLEFWSQILVYQLFHSRHKKMLGTRSYRFSHDSLSGTLRSEGCRPWFYTLVISRGGGEPAAQQPSLPAAQQPSLSAILIA